MSDVDEISIDQSEEGGPGNQSGLHKVYPLAAVKEWDHQPVCPYVCSTFEDFNTERHFLTDKIYPQIDQLCRQRGTYFAPNDFKHCVREREQPNLQWDLLRLGLNCINNAQPFFMCLLGERYGTFRPDESPLLPNNMAQLPDNPPWLDKNYLSAAESGYKWVLAESNQNCSLVELEIIQAAFLNDSEFCCFYFRQPDHIDSLLRNVPANEHRLLLSSYQSESEVAKLKIEDLKNRIVKRGLSVKYFCSLTQLGDAVLEDWRNIIDRLFPPLDLKRIGKMEAYWEQEFHRKFAVSRRAGFCQSEERKDIAELMSVFADSCTDETHATTVTEESDTWKRPLPFDLLKKKSHVNAKYKSILLLYGERGCGKSTIVANWLEKYTSAVHDYEYMYHFVGSSQRSFDITSFMRQVIFRMHREVLKSNIDCDIGALTLQDLTDFKYLCNTFFTAISLSPCVLVIDGVDELGATYDLECSYIKSFEWLPEVLPPQCKIIMTTCSCDWTYKMLLKRPDVQPVKVNEFHDHYLCQEYITEQCPDMNYWLEKGNAVDLFEHSKLVKNPLYLSLLVGELNDQVVHTRLEEYLRTYLDESLSTRDLMHHMLRRWIKELSWSLGTDWDDEGHEADVLYGWVAESLRLMCVSRNGLKDSDVLGCLKMMGYIDTVQVTPYHWTRFKTILQDILYEKPGGLMAFSHQHIRECLEFSLFGAVTPAAIPLVRSFALMPTIHDLDQKPYHVILANYLSESNDFDRQLYELPYHLEKSGQLEKLRNFITQEKVFLGFVGNGKNCYLNERKLDLIHYLKVLEGAGFKVMDTCVHVITVAGITTIHPQKKNILSEDILKPVDTPVITTDHCSTLSPTKSPITLASFTEIEEVRRALLKASSRYLVTAGSSVESFTNEEAHNMASVCTHVGLLLFEFGYKEVALQVLTMAFHLLFNNFPLSSREQLQMCVILEFIGRVNRNLCNMEEAQRHCRRALEYLLEQFNNESDTGDKQLGSDTVAAKGRLFKQLGAIILEGDCAVDVIEDAGVYLGEACRVMEKDTLEMSSIVHYIGLLRVKEEDYSKAETCFRQSINVRQQWYGKEHPIVAETTMELANVLNNPSNTKGFNKQLAEKLYRKTLNIREKMLGKEHLKVGLTLLALGRLLKDEDTKTVKREGVECFKRATDIFRVQLGPNHQATKDASLYFYWLRKNIQLGEYVYGPAKPKDTRTTERPVSAMTYHDRELAQMAGSSMTLLSPKQTAHNLAACAYASRFSVVSTRKSVPSSICFERRSVTRSACMSQAKYRQAINRTSMLPKTGVQRSLGREKYHVVSAQDEYLQSEVNDSEDKTNRQSVLLPPPVSSQAHGLSSHHFQLLDHVLPRHTNIEKFYKANLFASIQATRRPSLAEKRVIKFIPGTHHKAACHSPGPFDVCVGSSRVTFGPNMNIKSLLGVKRSPQNISKPAHHKAAWYHVPGRYPTVEKPLPPKRLQSRVIDEEQLRVMSHDGVNDVNVPSSVHSKSLHPNVHFSDVNLEYQPHDPQSTC